MVAKKSAGGPKKLFGLLHSLRAPRSAYQPLPRSLTEAVVTGDIDVVKAFIAKGEDLHQRTIGYASPLHAACSFGRLEIAKLLHKHGAPLEADGQIFSCIHFAAGKGFTEIIEWVFDTGFPLSEATSAFANAAVHGQYEVAKLMLERGVDSTSEKLYSAGAEKRTPALIAKTAGYTALAAFIEGKPFDQDKHAKERKRNYFATDDPDALDPGRVRESERSSAIESALEAIEKLDDPNALDADGFPGLVRAVFAREKSLVKAFLEAGANPNLKADFGGINPLAQAAVLGQFEIIELLLGSGAVIDIADGSGRTPLMFAVMRGDPKLVELFLGRGADAGKKDSGGKSAMKYVEGLYADEIKELLKAVKSKGGKKGKK